MAIADNLLLPQLDATASRDSLSPRAIAADTRRAVTKFFSADTIDEKLRFVRRPLTVRRMMEDYYGRFPRHPLSVSVERVHVVATNDSSQRENPLILATAQTPQGRLLPVMLEVTNGRYRVDWESQVGYSPASLARFRQAPSGRTRWFRVHASRSSYHNHSFDRPSEAIALRLDFPGATAPSYGYLERSHPQFSECVRLLDGQASPEARKQHQFEVVRLNQVGWLIEETSRVYTEAWAARSPR